jgi:hypothetical protein
LAWTPPSKIKLAAIGKNDFGEIESMLNPVGLSSNPCAADGAKRGGARQAARVLSSQLSILGKPACRLW